MKVKKLFSILSPLFMTAAFVVVASDSARAQGLEALGSESTPRPAAKYDEYGRVGHCDMTARLDNFALELQSDPRLKGFIVTYDAQGKGRGYASHSLKTSRHYLVHARGIAPERVVVVDGGARDIPEGMTQLWVVPEGAEPPVEAPAADKYAAKDFSGKFDSYFTDGQIYKEVVGMGYSASEIAHAEFAEKLKGQPDSVGYLVVHAAAVALQGEWRRVGRRDEQILAKDYGVEAGRLRTLYGGQAEGEVSEVEFWILPKSAPPPVSVTEEPTKKPGAAVRLNRFDSYNSLGKDAERWMLGNLAEVLRDNPRASACLIARPEAEVEMGEGAGVGEETAETDAEESSAADEQAEESGAEGEEGGDEISGSALEFAERWKELLVKEYGIEAGRVVILEGKPMPWSGGRLTTWLVPEKAPWPDPAARDEDESEESETMEGEEGERADGVDLSAVNAAGPSPARGRDGVRAGLFEIKSKESEEVWP